MLSMLPTRLVEQSKSPPRSDSPLMTTGFEAVFLAPDVSEYVVEVIAIICAAAYEGQTQRFYAGAAFERLFADARHV